MFIQTEDTPNPMTLKFLPNREVMGENKSADFPNEESAKVSPLALKIFSESQVSSVFLGSDFISVTKKENAEEWKYIKPNLLNVMMDFFLSGLPVMEVVLDVEAQEDEEDEENVDIKKIKELLDTRIRPAVAQDGGDIIFHGFDNGVVTLYMRGACAGCPSATATLKNGIENLLKHFVPSVQEVRAVE